LPSGADTGDAVTSVALHSSSCRKFDGSQAVGFFDGQWDSEKLVFILTVKSDLAANTTLTAAWVFINPGQGQQSPQIDVVAYIMPYSPDSVQQDLSSYLAELLRDGPVMGPYDVPKTGGTLMTIAGGADPLYVLAAQFNTAIISPSDHINGTSEGLVRNTITFDFMGPLG